MSRTSTSTRRTSRRFIVALCALTLPIAAFGAPATAGATTVAHARQTKATISGPVTTGAGPSVSTTTFDLGSVGYQQAEYFISGTANAYDPAVPLTNDGKWTVNPTTPAAFTTRLVVYSPKDPKKFNGTVIAEWLNVSGGLDAGPDWVQGHTELIREGFAWVGVSAQVVGVNNLKTTDAARYGSLNLPGDSYSYDIYSQAGTAIRQQADKILSGLTPKKVIAAGESQSAARMVTYIDALAKTSHVYDAYLVHSRSAAGAPLQGTPPPSVGTAPPGPAVLPVPSPTAIRNDIDTPVLVFQTETDALRPITGNSPELITEVPHP